MTAAMHCSRCGDLIAANSAYESAVVVGYFCSTRCRSFAELEPGNHNPFAVPARNRGSAANLTQAAQEAAEVGEDSSSPTSVAATFCNRLRASARRFDGMHPRPDLEVEHLTKAECEQLADELQRLTIIEDECLPLLYIQRAI